MDCLYMGDYSDYPAMRNGDNCPWNSFEDFGADFANATGIDLPMPEPYMRMDLDMVAACMSGEPAMRMEECPSMEDVLNLVQEVFGVNPSDEDIAYFQMCAADFLGQLGYNGMDTMYA